MKDTRIGYRQTMREKMGQSHMIGKYGKDIASFLKWQYCHDYQCRSTANALLYASTG